MQVLDTGIEAVGAPARKRGRPVRVDGAPPHRLPREQIDNSEALEWSQAYNFACSSLERPPTIHVAIQWRHAPSQADPFDRLQDLLNLFSIWSRRKLKHAPVWLYNRERNKVKGEHVHLLMHVPDRLVSQFEKTLRGWLALRAQDEGEDLPLHSAVRVERILSGLHGAAKTYHLKEGSDEVHRLFGVPASQRRKRTGLVIHGKRLAVSRSIGIKAQEDAGCRKLRPNRAREIAPEAALDS